MRAAPARELLPEDAAEASLLVPLVCSNAAELRRRRRRPEGWVPIHLGVAARTKTDGRTHWLDGEHASHWAWPEIDEALCAMRRLKERGTTRLVLLLWSPVWSRGELVEVGPPEHHDPFVRSLCWTLLRDYVPDTWARPNPADTGMLLEWRNERPGQPDQRVL